MFRKAGAFYDRFSGGTGDAAVRPENRKTVGTQKQKKDLEEDSEHIEIAGENDWATAQMGKEASRIGRKKEGERRHTADETAMPELIDARRRLREMGEVIDSQRSFIEKQAAEIMRREKEKGSLQADLRDVQARYQEAFALLGKELQGAHTTSMSSKADSVTSKEVVEMVSNLNSEILQTATFIAHSFHFDTHRPAMTDLRKQAYDRVKVDSGEDMAGLLVSVRHYEDPLLFQIAIQSSLAWYCKKIISTWYFGNADAGNSLLADIYEGAQNQGMCEYMST